MNMRIYNIIMSYATRPNTKEVRQDMVREIGAQLLVEAPTFTGTIVDRTSLLDETGGELNFKIKYNNKEYDINQFKLLAGIKDG